MRLFDLVEDALGLAAQHREDRASWTRSGAPAPTSRPASPPRSDRVVFINTGFLDRTGDEIHTAMEAGPVIRKDDIKAEPWIAAYENRNVEIGLAHRLPRPRPDRQGHVGRARPDGRDAGDEGRPPAGRRQHRLGAVAHRRHAARAALPPGRRGRACRRTMAAAGATTGLDDLLTPPLAQVQLERRPTCSRSWTTTPRASSATWSRWIDQGVGCSKVPDIHDVGPDGGPRHAAHLQPAHRQLAAPRRLHRGPGARDHGAHGQGGGRPERRRPGLHARWRRTSTAASPSRRRCDLVFEGRAQPNGYTEHILTRRRRERKAQVAAA